SALTRDPVRNELLVSLIQRLYAKFPQRKGLLLTARVAHAKRLYALLNNPDMCAVITSKVHTDMSSTERRQRKRRREETTFDKFITLSTYPMFAEAVDFDGDFVILATPKVRVEQPTGRVTRGRLGRERPV